MAISARFHVQFMKSIAANNGGIGTVSEDMILGALSLVIWTMTLVTTVKYVVIAMKADNHNEGGIFALFSLVRKVAPWLILPAMIGGAALLADGILTPAVTVTTAIEWWAHHRAGSARFWVTARPTSSSSPSSLSAAYLPCSAPVPRQSASSSARLMTLWLLFWQALACSTCSANCPSCARSTPSAASCFCSRPSTIRALWCSALSSSPIDNRCRGALPGHGPGGCKKHLCILAIC